MLTYKRFQNVGLESSRSNIDYNTILKKSISHSIMEDKKSILGQTIAVGIFITSKKGVNIMKVMKKDGLLASNHGHMVIY